MENDNEDLWIEDPARGTRTRLSFEPGGESAPAWSPDGARVAYHANPPGCDGLARCYHVMMRPADGTGTPDTIGLGVLPAFSPDGRHLLCTTFTGPELRDWSLVAIPLEGDRKPITLVRGNPYVADGRVRPGGDLLAYMSNESGGWEVYLTRFPTGEGRWQVSVAGGEWPRWTDAGDRLYFVQGEEMMEVSVSVGASGTPTLGRPERLFSRPPGGQWLFSWHTGYDVSGDGGRFVVSRPAGDRARPPSVIVIQNWFAEFKGRK
jgi:Tol biopolymer transport system component